MNQLLPAILVQDEAAFRERLKLVEGLVPVVHLDVMDGAFVPNRTWFDAKVLAELETPLQIELHLMVKDPARIIEEVRGVEKVVRAIWHVEVGIDHAALIENVHGMKKEAGLAISPKTPVDQLTRYAADLDEILVMGGEPGFGGQRHEPHTIDKAWEIHGRWPEVALGFDINVNTETIPKLKAAGISRFCAGSAVFGAKDPKKEIERLNKLLN
jgi:ribulose-phosphate 3-epimerase